MRVVHVIVSLYDGGAQAVLFNLLTHDRSHEHYVISLTSEGKYSGPIDAMGVEVHHLDMPRGKFTVPGLWKLYGLMKRIQPDVVQTWMYHSDLLGGLAARCVGIRNIVWGIHHSTLDKKGTSRNTRVVVSLLTTLSKFLPKKIISCSQKALEVHAQKGYASSKLVFVGNGYDLEKFQPDPDALSDLDLAIDTSVLEGRTVFATVARWDAQKDQRNLVDACQHLVAQGAPPFVSLLIGPNMDADNHELASYIRERQLDDVVLLCGSTGNVPAVMNSVDFHVLPSAFGEAFPNVVAEAMSCSTPCVVTDVGDAAAMVADTGWVVPPRDSTALAEAIRTAMHESTQSGSWQDRKSACRARALDTFDIHKMIGAYEGVWRS
ncbi:MAG: glycosyltransferase [Granulosicoccus sp.]